MTVGLTLALDASTSTASVALLRGTELLAERLATAGRGAEDRVLPAVASILAEHGVEVGSLARIVCGAGPGSFTGLRIAASLAKGLSAATGVPLFAVSSLALVAAGADLVPGRYIAVLDALRGEVFTAPFSVERDEVRALAPPSLVPRESLPSLAAERGALLVGPAEERRAAPRAGGVRRLEIELCAAGPVALADWEPDYGRLAEAQARWERTHGRPLGA